MAGQWSMRAAASWLLAISCFAGGAPTVAQESFSAAEVCRDLKSIYAAVDKSDLRSLKGKRLDKTKWQAARNFPGMSECVVEDPPETKDLETFLFQESGLMCEVSIEVKRPDLTGVTDIEKVKAANRTAAIAAREEAVKLFSAYEKGIVGCLPDMVVERPEPLSRLEKDLPQLKLKKAKAGIKDAEVRLRLTRSVRRIILSLSVTD